MSSLDRRIRSDSACTLKAKTKECANGLDVGVRKNKSLEYDSNVLVLAEKLFLVRLLPL